MTMTKFFCMPADFKKETIDEYDKLNKTYPQSKIVETYGNITVGNRVGSGRAVSQLPDTDLLDLKLFIDYSTQKNIGFNYTINATHLQNKEFSSEGVREIERFLKDLYAAGVRSLTIALPSLLELVQAMGNDFEIKTSTLCQVTNVNKALAYKNRGVNRIVVDESINRNFKTLRRICEIFGDKVEMIVNPICLKDCTYRMFHYNEITGDSLGRTNDVSVNYYEHRCVLQRFTSTGNLLRMCFVRPEDLRFYTEIGIRYFKLQGRHLVLKGDAVRTIKAYLDEKFDGDLMDLIYMFYPQNSFNIPFDNKKLEGFIKPFLNQGHDFCRRDCLQCGYCEEFAKKIIDYDHAGKVIKKAREFYSEYDRFNQMIHHRDGYTANHIEAGDATAGNMEIDFEL